MYDRFIKHPTNIADRDAWKEVTAPGNHLIFEPFSGENSRQAFACNFIQFISESFKMLLSQTEPARGMDDFNKIHSSSICLTAKTPLPMEGDDYYAMSFLAMTYLEELGLEKMWLSKDFTNSSMTFHYFHTESGSNFPGMAQNRIYRLTINRYTGDIITEGKQKRSARQQIILETVSAMRKANGSKCVLSSGNSEVKNFLKPMCAHDLTSQKSSSNLSIDDVRGWFRPTEYPKMVQEKIDGMRATARMVGGQIEFLSREQNIIAKANSLFGEDVKQLLGFLPADSVIDGELWSDGFSAAKISGFFKAFEKNMTDIHVKIGGGAIYRIFGFFCPGSGEKITAFDRYEILKRAFSCSKITRSQLVPSVYVATPEDLFNIIRQVAELNLEGIMIYSNEPYTHTRTKHLLKFKLANEVDLPLMSVTTASGHEAGQAVFIFEHLGEYFQVRPCLTKEERIAILINPPRIGTVFKIKYYGFTEDGKFRHPTMLPS